MNINNRRTNKKDMTFFQWLNTYEAMCKREFKELPKQKQDDYRKNFEQWQRGELHEEKC